MATPSPQLNDNVCSTSIKYKDYTISQTWIIKDFASVVAASAVEPMQMYSEPFGDKSDPEATFKMQFYVCGASAAAAPVDQDAKVDKQFSLFIVLDRKITSLRKYSKFELLTPMIDSSTPGEFKPGAGLGLKQPLSRLDKFVNEDGDLYVNCRVTIVRESQPKFENEILRSAGKDTRSFSHFQAEMMTNFRNFLKSSLNDGDLSDFTIRTVNNRAFQVHKFVLAAHSEVFSRMFQGSFRENGVNEMRIPDVSSEAVEQFLLFLYDKAVMEDFTDLADELLVLGEKYSVDLLKNVAENIVIKNLSLENVCQSLVLAEQQRATQLRKCSIEFILEHKRKVVKLDAWNELKRSNPALIAEILESVWNEGDSGSPRSKKRRK